MLRHARNDAERFAWFRLVRPRNVGPIPSQQPPTRYGSETSARASLPELAARGSGKSLNPPNLRNVECEFTAPKKAYAQLLPQTQHFPHLNLIISVICQIIVIVKAGLQSDSLKAARMALEQGHKSCSNPDSPLALRARGSNNLINNGTVLIQSATDALACLRSQMPLFKPPPAIILPPHSDENPPDPVKIRQQVIDNISPSPTSVDEIIRECHVSAPAVITVLLVLDLVGRFAKDAGKPGLSGQLIFL